MDFVAETSGTRAEPVHKERERECKQILPRFNLLGNQNQLFDGGTQTNLGGGHRRKGQTLSKSKTIQKGITCTQFDRKCSLSRWANVQT
ncbi:hypothetical protein B7P43_G08593 [Cryptotermes secundus]|uniref:Uncharacterized protein n=2 Tax=Cryptotermes secundus TaxID=105785 RepID=A0A2J7QZ05_9NEOP|nr:hypothetical protein B7P43_G08593 [Cryptotermes secundus]